MEIKKWGAGVFTIESFLSADECTAHIRQSEDNGYEVATIQAISGPEMNTEIRHNDRVIYDSYDLASSIYQKVKEHLPQSIDNWRLTGLNERFRFYRYSGEHYFKWHKDGTYCRSETEESMLTLMIYLSDEFEQGYTEFSWEKIQPKIGMALVFPHRLSHRATSAINGTKYVLRTDVMYSKGNEQDKKQYHVI